METGIDKEKLKAAKAAFLAYASDPARLRLLVSAVILAVGLGALCWPQAKRLKKATKELEKAETKLTTAKELHHYASQIETYKKRVPKTLDVGKWQDYVMVKLADSGLKLRKLEPKKLQRAGGLKMVPLDLEAEGLYENIVDFIDRMERGEYLVRLNRVAFERNVESIALRCTIVGLVKTQYVPRKKKAGSSGKSTKKGTAGKGAPPNPAKGSKGVNQTDKQEKKDTAPTSDNGVKDAEPPGTTQDKDKKIEKSPNVKTHG